MAILFVTSVGFMIRFIVAGGSEIAEVAGVLVNSLVAALGFFAIYASIQNDKVIKRFEYIEDYNFNFLTNKEFITVERKLETCNQAYLAIDERCKGIWTSKQEAEYQAYCDRVFHTVAFCYSDNPNDKNTRIDEDGMISAEYQEIVNYLVYLESFVPLLNHGQIEFEEVDDLFGYRYFIAVNNPVLQMNELCRERQYYRGIFKVFGKWKEHRKGQMPMKNYDLMERWEQYKERNPRAEE